MTLQQSPVSVLPDLPPRRQVLLHDPVASYLAGLDESTQEAVRRSLRRVAKLLEVPAPEAVPWESMRYGHYQAIKGKLLAYRRDSDNPDSGLSPGTINLTLTHLRGVARQVWSLGYMTAEEWERVKEIKPTKGERLPAGRDARAGELAALLEACGGDHSPAGVRDAAIIALLYSTGMRRAELVGLDREDYDSETGTLKVRRGKGRKERLVYAAGGAHAALADWLVVRGDRPGALFVAVNKGGRLGSGRITAQAIYNMLDKRVREARLGLPLSPHDLRRTFVVICTNCGHENIVPRRHAQP
ncbi:MAG: tyrosine-type recombinase/integrase [Chloroflexota bacterium]|nr:tyrosine-type recombinase/integrase [Chloroflexota bacterium]